MPNDRVPRYCENNADLKTKFSSRTDGQAADLKNRGPRYPLSHALVEASATGLQLAATDLELGIRVFCPASVRAAGHGVIPARRLLDIVRSLPDGEVRVRALENQWVQIGSGRSTFKLAAMAKRVAQTWCPLKSAAFLRRLPKTAD